jgi:hypothetical protein
MTLEMPLPEEITCQAASCACPVGTAEKYCCEECKLAEKDEDFACPCHHAPCDEDSYETRS